MNKKFILLIFMCLLGATNLSKIYGQEVEIPAENSSYSSSNSRSVPTSTYYNNSISQQYYLKNDIGSSINEITDIAFKTYSSTDYTYTRHLVIYMDNTNDSCFSSTDMVQLDDSDLVFDGYVSFDEAHKWVNITLNKKFTYTGSNIILCVWDQTGSYTQSDSYFTTFSLTDSSAEDFYRAIYQTTSSRIKDPTDNVVSGTKTNHTPAIKFINIKKGISVTLNEPTNTYTNIFNPQLNFNVSGATEYSVYLGTSEDNMELKETKTGNEVNGSNSYQPNLLQPNTTYYWKVVATDGTNTAGDDQVYSFTTADFTGPGGISNAYPISNETLTAPPTLTWDFGSWSEQYQVWMGTSENNLTLVQDWTNTQNNTSASFITSNLDTYCNHYWRVDVKNSVGTTTGSVNSFYLTGIPNNVAPITPEDGATGVTSNVIKWQFAEGTEQYRFLYGEDLNNLAYRVGTSYNNAWQETNSVTEVQIEAPDFETNKTYYWAVDVKNNAGERIYYNYVDGVLTPQVAVYSFTTTNIFPVTLSTDNGIVTNGSATLEWTYGTGNAATHYQVYWGKDENNLTNNTDWLERSTAGTGGLNATDSYTITESLDNAVYYYRVDVKKGEEGETVTGNVYSFVNGLNITEVNPTEINNYESTKITWNAIAGATGYNVEVDGMRANIETITEVSYELSGLKSGTRNITVKAVYPHNNISIESKASDAASVNVTAAGKLSVTVTDGTNPVEGATVSFNGNTVTTDANGYVEIVTTPGTYTLTVTKDSYDDYNEDVEITENNTKEITVSLQQSLPGDVTPITPEDKATDIYRPTLEWKFASNTTHYRVLVNSVYEVGGTSNWIETGGAEEGSFVITDQLEANTVYEWCVDVKNDAGSRAMFGGDADVAKYTFTTSPVVEVNYTAPADNSVTASTDVTLTWNYRNNNEADEYQILCGTTNPPTDVLADWTARGTATVGDVASFLMTESYTAELSVNTKYYWQVNVRKDEVVREGSIWSFVTPMNIPENISVPYTEILPVANQNYGTTTVSWDELSDGAKYNVYVDGNKHNTNPIEATSYDIPELSIGSHSIYVTAVYEGIGESEKSAVLDVTVVGNAEVNIYVEDENGGYIEGATVKFYHIVDEALSGQAYENLNVTNNTGALSVKLGVGKYNMVITKDKFDDFTLNDIEIKSTGYGKTVTLTSDYIFFVEATEKNHDMLAVSLERGEGGYFDLHIEKDGEIYSTEKGQYFSHNGTSAYHEYNIWGTLPNGRYRFGVAVRDSDIINWSDYILSRNYAIFENTDGNWNESANWRNRTLPEAHNRIFIYKSCTILGGEGFTAGEINIKDGGSLTLNGSLTVTGEIFNTDASKLVLHDGAQLRHASTDEVKATHIMNIANPTEWVETNKTGWQFISSMFTDAKISDFTTVDAEDDYDLYKYVGSSEFEWVNHKNGDFETNFKQGTAYLASYKVADNVTIDGTLNNEKSFNYQLPYNSNKDLQNFSLIGNPFSFDMDWTKVYAPGLVAGYATVNNDGTYAYHLSGTIPAGDGFFVKAASSANYISYNDDKIATATRNEQNDFINVIAENKSGKDNVIINFAGAEEEGFTKLNNFNDEIANIFITENDKRYGIVNYDKDVKEVELNFIASQMGSYNIQIELSGEFDYIVLVDKQTGIETNMLLEDEYRFTATNNDKYDRFVLKLSYANNDSDDENSSFVYQSGEDLIIDAEGTIQIIDMMGRVVYEDSVESTNNRISISNLNKSTYVVRSINGNGIRTQKIVIL